jgi:hypothetical protein
VQAPPGNRSSRKQSEQSWEVTKWLSAATVFSIQSLSRRLEQHRVNDRRVVIGDRRIGAGSVNTTWNYAGAYRLVLGD